MRVGFFNNLLDDAHIYEDVIREMQSALVEPLRAEGYEVEHEMAGSLPFLHQLYSVIIIHPQTMPWKPHPSSIVALAPKPTLVVTGSKAKQEGMEMLLGKSPHLRYTHSMTPESFLAFLEEAKNPARFVQPPTLVERVRAYFSGTP